MKIYEGMYQSDTELIDNRIACDDHSNEECKRNRSKGIAIFPSCYGKNYSSYKKGNAEEANGRNTLTKKNDGKENSSDDAAASGDWIYG